MARCRTTRRGSASRSGTAWRKLPHSICKKVNRFTSRVDCAWKSTSIAMANHATRSKCLRLTYTSSARVAAMKAAAHTNARPRRAPAAVVVADLRKHREICQTTISRSKHNLIRVNDSAQLGEMRVVNVCHYSSNEAQPLLIQKSLTQPVSVVISPVG